MVVGIYAEHFLIKVGGIEVGKVDGAHVGSAGCNEYELGTVTELGNHDGQFVIGVYVDNGVM